MPLPSLHSYYGCFNTTTKWSAAIASPQPAMSASPFTVLQSDNDFTRSDVSPVQMSCQLNPGRGTTSSPVSVVLIPGANVPTRFSLRFALSGLHHWFTLVQLILDVTAGVITPAFKPIAHHHIVSFAAA